MPSRYGSVATNRSSGYLTKTSSRAGGTSQRAGLLVRGMLMRSREIATPPVPSKANTRKGRATGSNKNPFGHRTSGGPTSDYRRMKVAFESLVERSTNTDEELAWCIAFGREYAALTQHERNLGPVAEGTELMSGRDINRIWQTKY